MITGGGSGIGEALARQLGRRGAAVVVADLDDAAGQRVAGELAAAGTAALAVATDVAREGDVTALLERAVERFGRVDLMVNNAGIGLNGEVRDLTTEHWRRLLDVNLWGVIHGSHQAYRLMAEQGGGHIVNVASIAGLIPLPINTVYTTAKHAVVGLSTALRAEGRELGVRVSAVCPGYVRTGIFATGAVVGARQEDLRGESWQHRQRWLMVEPADAARRILRGVERDRAVIVFPFYVRLLWWLHRLHPALLNRLHRGSVRSFRRIRRPCDVPERSDPQR